LRCEKEAVMELDWHSGRSGLPLIESAAEDPEIDLAAVRGYRLGRLREEMRRRDIAACLLFTAWGVLTEPGVRLVNLGNLNFEMNPIMIGVLGHVVSFVTGYVVSLVAGGYVPDDVDELRFHFGRRA